MINELFYILYVFQVFETWHVFYTWSTSPLRLLPFQVLRSLLLTHMGPSWSFSPCRLAPACFSSPTVSLYRTHIPGPLLCKFWSRWGEDVAEAGEPGPCEGVWGNSPTPSCLHFHFLCFRAFRQPKNEALRCYWGFPSLAHLRLYQVTQMVFEKVKGIK